MADSLTIERTYFERLYAESNDPWNFAESWYERRKYDLTLAALPAEHYDRVFEPGCSIGVLSARLAARCTELVAMELMPSVAAMARERLGPYNGASVIEGSIPAHWPAGKFDLIVLSEVAYYLTARGLEQTIALLRKSLRPGGTIVSVHYTLETDYPLTGQQVGEHLRQQGWLTEVSSYSERSFELVVLQA